MLRCGSKILEDGSKFADDNILGEDSFLKQKIAKFTKNRSGSSAKNLYLVAPSRR